jgi:hypothetical protein
MTLTSSEERSIKVNAMSLDCMEYRDNENNINLLINRDFFDLISFESYLSMYPYLCVDCSSNNNYSINSHLEFPLYTYLYSYDNEIIV